MLHYRHTESRYPGFSESGVFWTLVFTGVTTFYDGITKNTKKTAGLTINFLRLVASHSYTPFTACMQYATAIQMVYIAGVVHFAPVG